MQEKIVELDGVTEYISSIMPSIVRPLVEEYIPNTRQDQQKEDKYRAMHGALKGLFERYRESEPEGALRTVIDMLLRVNIKCAPPNDDGFRKRHNAVVLRYITEKPMTDKELCRRLKIPAGQLEKRIDLAIEDMMPSFYGVDVLDVMP